MLGAAENGGEVAEVKQYRVRVIVCAIVHFKEMRILKE